MNMLSIGLFLPLVGFLTLLITANSIGRRFAGYIACTTISISFVCFVTLLMSYLTTSSTPYTLSLYQWIPITRINADFSLHVDSLSLVMTLIITGIGALIHIYSIGYMEHEEDFARYFACLNFFVFMMLLLVLAGNLLLLFVGWEGVGLASYLLIGFWYHRPAAAHAATKAFIVNRVGDLGLLLGLLLTLYLFGTTNFDEISQRVGIEFAVGAPVISLLAFLYFTGAVGKSAQLPLHVWLPDAMEGPTPVSALIHAATMVTAGVYLVVRMHAIFLLAPLTMYIVAIVGAATALFAAFSALGQTDLKRVLAYSTVSQLGLMFLACGVGAFYAAMFHLITHAFVKALLFLSAGNVVHMMHGSTDMEKMGGLSKKFTKTHILFLVGVLSMSGIPPLAAFFSKDLILEQVNHTGFHILFYIGLLTSFLTAFYLMRAYCLTFRGEQRLEGKIVKVVKEAPAVMLIPVAILAVLSIFGGFLGFSVNKPSSLENFLLETGVNLANNELSTGFHLSITAWLSIFLAVVGVLISAIIYTKYADRLKGSVNLLKNSFYIDEVYQKGIVFPLKALSKLIREVIEPDIFDGFINVTIQTIQKTAKLLQKFQSGQIRSYIAWMAIGTTILVVYLVF
jgi:NADH-quinone oxidoreductase subunit L